MWRVKYLIKLIYRGELNLASMLIRGFAKKRARTLFTKISRVISFDVIKKPRQLDSSLILIDGQPLVTIVIPHVNYSNFLEKCLTSIKMSTFPAFEVVVVESGSDVAHRDNFIATSKKWTSKDYRFFVFVERNRLGVNRNIGVKESKAQICLAFDPDDLMHPMYLEICMFLKLTKVMDVTSSRISIRGNEIGTWGGAGKLTARDFAFQNQISSHSLFQKDLWSHIGGFKDSEQHEPYIFEDWWFWQRAALSNARVYANVKELNVINIHGSNMSRAPELVSESTQAKLIRMKNRDMLKGKSFRSSKYNKSELMISSKSFKDYCSFIAKARNLENKVNVLIFLPWLDNSGASKYVKSIVSNLAEDNFNFIFVTTESNSNDKSDFSKFRFNNFPVYNLNDILNQSEWLLFLEYLLSTYEISSIWQLGSNWLYENVKYLRSKFENKIVFVGTLFNKNSDHFRTHKKLQEFFDYTIFESPRLMNDYVVSSNNYSGILNSAPNGISKREVKSSVKTVHDLELGKLEIAFVGRLSPEKDPFMFINVAKIMSMMNPGKFVFSIYGDGPLFNDCEKLTQMLSFPIELHGNVDEADLLFSSIGLLLVTSTEIEGRPNVILESSSRGIPVVAFDVGYIDEILMNGQTGVIVANRSARDMALAAHNLVNDPQNYRMMSQTSIDVSQTLTWDDACETYRTAFESNVSLR